MEANQTTPLTVMAATIGGLYNSLCDIDITHLQMHISPSQALQVAENAAIGGVVGGVIGYLVKYILDKIFKPKNKVE